MDLHGQIMNIQCRDGDALNAEFSDRRIAFKTGHKEARHAAAELALGVEAQIAAAVAAERERWRAALAPVFSATEGELPHALYVLRGFAPLD